MRKFSAIFLSCVFFHFCCSALCNGEEKKEVKTHPSPEDMQKAQQGQQWRPILPPVVSQVPSMISPTPSPHITAPQIPPQIIAQPSTVSHVPQPSGMQNIPSTPAYAMPPSIPVSMDIPQVPIIGNTIGKVISLGSEKDGTPWIEVHDNLFGELVMIKLKNLKNIPIVKQAQVYNFKDIKAGDTVNAVFHTEGNDNVANFINVMTEEEIEIMNQAPTQELTVTPQKSQDSAKPQAPQENNTQPKNSDGQKAR